jgi:hypothetical protein
VRYPFPDLTRKSAGNKTDSAERLTGLALPHRTHFTPDLVINSVVGSSWVNGNLNNVDVQNIPEGSEKFPIRSMPFSSRFTAIRGQKPSKLIQMKGFLYFLISYIRVLKDKHHW